MNGFCITCKQHTATKSAHFRNLKNGAAMVSGVCADCGNKKSSIISKKLAGGRRLSGGRTLPGPGDVGYDGKIVSGRRRSEPAFMKKLRGGRRLLGPEKPLTAFQKKLGMSNYDENPRAISKGMDAATVAAAMRSMEKHPIRIPRK